MTKALLILVNPLKRIDCLFVDLPHLRDGYGHKFSKWFNRTYINKANCNAGLLPDESKNFHSFRHTAITQWMNTHNITSTVVSKLVGQKSTDKSEAAITYTKKLSISENNKQIKIPYRFQ